MLRTIDANRPAEPDLAPQRLSVLFSDGTLAPLTSRWAVSSRRPPSFSQPWTLRQHLVVAAATVGLTIPGPLARLGDVTWLAALTAASVAAGCFLMVEGSHLVWTVFRDEAATVDALFGEATSPDFEAVSHRASRLFSQLHQLTAAMVGTVLVVLSYVAGFQLFSTGSLLLSGLTSIVCGRSPGCG